MSPTKVLFFFDTEDFTCERSSDAIVMLANLMREEGVTGHFGLVGLLADRLRRNGRTDVLDALKHHIIGTHTYGHSLHPDLCEQTDFSDFSQAYANVDKTESVALEMIRQATGVDKPMFACPPGDCNSYVAMYWYAAHGIPFNCGTVLDDSRGSQLYYCGQRQIGYTCSIEGLFLSKNPRNFEQDIPRLLDNWAQNRDTIILYIHPNMVVKKVFWDALNYNKGNQSEFGKWIEAPDRSAEETQQFLDNVRRLVRMIKADSRYEIVNLRSMLSEQKSRHTVTRSDIPCILAQLEQKFAPISEPSLSISEVFCACVALLTGADEYTPTIAKGFLETPVGISSPVTVTRDDIIQAAQKIDTSSFIPSHIHVGEHLLGAADFLFAMLGFLAGKNQSLVLPVREQLNDITDLPKLCNLSLKNTWMHTPSLEDKWLSDRLRLQAWTRRN